MQRITLKRIAPGYYETHDGGYEVVRTDPVPGWPKGAWFWRENRPGAMADDWYWSKRDAVAALAAWILDGEL